MMNFRKERSTLSNEIAEIIKNKIFLRELKEGEKITVADIAKEVGASSTPVKEALKQLQGRDLVVLKPGRGFFVKEIDENDIEEIFECRLAIELFCIEKAIKECPDQVVKEMEKYLAESKILIKDSDYVNTIQFMSIDHKFHTTYVNASANKRLIDTYEKLNIHLQITWMLYSQTQKRGEETYLEHQKIFDLLQQRKIEETRECIQEHISKTLIHIKKVISNTNAILSHLVKV